MPFISIDPQNGKNSYMRNISYAEYDYLVRRDLMHKPKMITEEVFDKIPAVLSWERVTEGTNPMRINLSKSQIAKLKYGRNLNIEPDQVDTIGHGTIIRHLSNDNRETLIRNRRLHRKTKLKLTDKELLGTWVRW